MNVMRIKKREEYQAEVKEVLAEIVAVVSILIKFGHDDILENYDLFIEFINELGIRFSGRRLTPFLMDTLKNDVTAKAKKEILEEFSVGHEPLYRRLVMVGAVN